MCIRLRVEVRGNYLEKCYKVSSEEHRFYLKVFKIDIMFFEYPILKSE